MGLEIIHLGSGSRGNSTLVTSGDSSILIDCGFSLKQIELRLKRIDVKPDSIDAIIEDSKTKMNSEISDKEKYLLSYKIDTLKEINS